MADTKISDMTAAENLTGADIPIVQGGENKKAAAALFTANILTGASAIVVLTEAEYTALDPKVETTLYITVPGA